MGRYLRRRLLTAIPVFFGITILVFCMLNLAQGSILDLMGEGSGATDADRAALAASLGLDLPLPQRYLMWLGDLLRGDLGVSYANGKPVAGLIAQRVGPSLLLTGTGVVLAVAIALPLGVLAAWKPRSGWDRAASALSLISFGVPGFFLCLAGIFLFSITLGWLPANGMYAAGRFSGLADLLRHLILPAGVVCLSSVGELVKQTRAACLEALGEDYIRTALTTILSHIPHILGGSVVVEQIFGWPGMGSLLFSGISGRDYTVVMGVTVVIALAVLLTNLLLDLVYGLADPRVRYGKE